MKKTDKYLSEYGAFLSRPNTPNSSNTGCFQPLNGLNGTCKIICVALEWLPRKFFLKNDQTRSILVYFGSQYFPRKILWYSKNKNGVLKALK